MGHNPREHVCELFDFECMSKNKRCLYVTKLRKFGTPQIKVISQYINRTDF
jgi:hypothetical protein